MSNGASKQLIRAAAVVDGSGVNSSPGVLLLEGREVVAAGSPGSIGEVPGAEVIEQAGAVLLPAMVNAHSHLDLSSIEPSPFTGEFDTWLEVIGDCRKGQTEATRRADTEHGIALSLSGGTAFVGDISGARHLEPLEALRRSPLRGTSFVEFFGLGSRQDAGVDPMREVAGSIPLDAGNVRLGISPHALYSCGPRVYEAAMETGLPVATHLAESLEEEEMIRHESGSFRDLTERYGAWNDETKMPGCHPVDALAGVMEQRPVMVVHLNYIEDEHIELLSRTGTRVVYCPRASDYFGHPHAGHPGHRYQQMLASGVTVALGTDSLCCLDTPDRISVLDEMRHLHVRDGADPALLLSMGTVHGARALEIDESLVSFAPGPIAGVIAVDVSEESMRRTGALAGAFSQRNAPRWVLAPEGVAGAAV